MVGISVIAANLTRVGHLIREAERDRRKCQQRAASLVEKSDSN